MWFKETLSHKKKFLSSLLKAPIEQLAMLAPAHWENSEELSQILQNSLCRLPHCQLLYAVDSEGQQISANIARNNVESTWHGQDLAERPYLSGSLPYQGMILSSAYLSQRSMQPCITAVQAVRNKQGLLGFIAADFHLNDVPNTVHSPLSRKPVSTYGQGSIENQYQHLNTETDNNIDYLIYVLTSLVQEHGIFHFQLDFDSAQCSLWSIKEPTRYSVHSIAELMNPELFIQYPKITQINKDNIDIDKVTLVLAQFKILRNMDHEIYLQSASLNIVNDMVNLVLNYNGSQYISTNDLLNKDLLFWLNLNSENKGLNEIATQN